MYDRKMGAKENSIFLSIHLPVSICCLLSCVWAETVNEDRVRQSGKAISQFPGFLAQGRLANGDDIRHIGR